jgi:pimeloyl-ACP methyl ester carboxylesterase
MKRGSISRADDQVGAQLLRLADGRRLGFAEYGASGGRPVLFFHGTPGARLLAGFAHHSALRLNVRLIAPERPGFGRSDFQAGRGILEWPDDVAALADALGLERFAVAGVSGGAPYALACARRLPERIRVVGVVSGMTPLEGPPPWPPLGRGRRLTLAAVRRLPWLSRGAIGLAAPVVRRWPGRTLGLVAALAPAADAAILARPEVRAALIDDLREALRGGGRGAAHELALFGRPWGFCPGEVRIPVELWHGEADPAVPVAAARRLAGRMPTCTARFRADAGHFWLFDHHAEVLATLCPPDLPA